jgi:hypothetical protein
LSVNIFECIDIGHLADYIVDTVSGQDLETLIGSQFVVELTADWWHFSIATEKKSRIQKSHSLFA